MTRDDGMAHATLHLPTRKEAIEQQQQAILDRAKPCPFCGGTALVIGDWILDEGEEVWSIECKTCYGAAPYLSWQQRKT